MTVFFNKHRGRWSFDFWKGGKRYTGYCLDAHGEPVRSRSAAVQAEGVEKRRAEIEPKVAKAGELTVAQAISALAPVWQTQANWIERQRWLKELIAFFGAETAIADIDQARVDDYISACRTTKIRVWHGGPARDPLDDRHARFWKTTEKTRAPATSNLYLGTLRQIFSRAAAHRDPNTGRPLFENLPKVPELAIPKRKARPMPDQVAADIIEIMPPHVIDAIVLTAVFGFRRGEAFALQRTDIDWQAQGVRLLAEAVKDAEDIFLPASQFAMGWLRCLDIEAERRGMKHLITWQRSYKDPEAMKDAPAMALKIPRSAWRRARALMLEKYGRTWRWHDLRAAYITRVAIGSGGIVAQKLARHSDPSTTQGYIEVADELTRVAADRVADQIGFLRSGESPKHESLTPAIKLRAVPK